MTDYALKARLLKDQEVVRRLQPAICDYCGQPMQHHLRRDRWEQYKDETVALDCKPAAEAAWLEATREPRGARLFYGSLVGLSIVMGGLIAAVWRWF